MRARIRHCLLCIVTLFTLTPIILEAQTTGTLRGIVAGPEGPVQGATVRLVGTNRGAITKHDGSFIVAGIRAGTYDVAISRIGYSMQTLKVKIDVGEITDLSSQLPLSYLSNNPIHALSDSLILLYYSGKADPSRLVHLKAYRLIDPVRFFLDNPDRASLEPQLPTRQDPEYWEEEWRYRLVADWHHRTEKIGPHQYINSEPIPIPIREPGVYLIEVDGAGSTDLCFVVISDLTVITKESGNTMLTYVANARTGRKVADFPLTSFHSDGSRSHHRTGYDGTVSIAGKQNPGAPTYFPTLIGERGDQFVMATGNWNSGVATAIGATYLQTDRPIYRPAQTVHLRGIARIMESWDYKIPRNGEVIVEIHDPRGRTLKRTKLPLSRLGTFNDSIRIVDEAPLGIYSIVVLFEHRSASYQFEVQEYKKPEYSVEVIPTQQRIAHGEPIRADVRARYFFGSPVANAEVEYHIYRTGINGAVSNYSYGTPQPEAPTMVHTAKGKLTGEGTFRIEYPTTLDSMRDYSYRIQAKVVDNSRRAISGIGTIKATRGEFGIEASTEKNFYRVRDRATIELSVKSFSDSAVSRLPITLQAVRHWWRRDKGGAYLEESEVIWNGSTVTDGKGRARILYPADRGGYIELKAEVSDSRTKKIAASRVIHVVDEGYDKWFVPNQPLRVIPERESYETGETFRALVITNRPTLDVLVTSEGHTLYSHEVTRLKKHAAIVEIPLRELHAPNFTLGTMAAVDRGLLNVNHQINVTPIHRIVNMEIATGKASYKPGDSGVVKVRALDRLGAPIRNADVAIGIVDRSIYDIAPERAPGIVGHFYPRKENLVRSRQLGTRDFNTTIAQRYMFIHLSREVTITSARTRIQGAVALTPGVTTSGVNGFSIRGGRVQETAIRTDGVAVSDPFAGGFGDVQVISSGFAPEYGDILSGVVNSTTGGVPGPMLIEPAMRSEFLDLMAWAPSLRTDSEGYASLGVRFPDNITTWRITARAVTDETAVGEGVKDVIARKNLLVRMETPRFLTQGDELLIATTIHNYLDRDKKAVVRMRGENVEMENRETTITIPAGGEQRIDWHAKASGLDTARFAVRVLTDEESDAMEMKVPILPRGLKRVVNGMITLDPEKSSETITLTIPEESDPATMKLSISLSPSVTGTVIGALDDLVGYPYGCAEQTMSRFLPTVVVVNALNELGLPFNQRKREELPKMVQAGLDRLYGFQHGDGGWGWWYDDPTNPFMTAYIIYGLAAAQRAGYEIPHQRLDAGLASLRKQIADRKDPRQGTLHPVTEAYMIYVASYVGRTRNDRFLVDRIEKLTVDKEINAYGMALLTLAAHHQKETDLADRLAARLAASATTTSREASWPPVSSQYYWYGDGVEASAFALRALLETGADRKLMHRAANWLITQKRGSSWRSTRQTAMVIYALVDYLRVNNAGADEYDVTVTVNGTSVHKRRMGGKNGMTYDERITVDAAELRIGENTIVVEKRGNGGTLHASAWIDFYTDVSKLRPMSNGFDVAREYYLLRRERHGDGYRYVKDRFTGEVKSGDELLVKVTLRSYAAHEYFLLEDPLPAGCEVVTNTEGYIIEDESEYTGLAPAPNSRRWWYSSRDVRDEKIAFFAEHLAPREYQFTYILRAQIPGTYEVMPTVGLLNYFPEVNGNSTTEQMTIK